MTDEQYSRKSILSDNANPNVDRSVGSKGAGLFQRAGQTMKQAAGRGTSRYPNGIKR